MTDLVTRMQAAAEAVSDREFDADDIEMALMRYCSLYPNARAIGFWGYTKAYAAHIVASQPRDVLALIARVKAAETECARWHAAASSRVEGEWDRLTLVEQQAALLRQAEAALEPFAAFADALNEQTPDSIALGIFADGAMRFGPSGGAGVDSLRNARTTLAAIQGAKP